MSDSLLGPLAAARWYLPVRTPGDKGTEDRAACGVIDASYALASTPIGTQRYAPFAPSEPIGLSDQPINPTPDDAMTVSEDEGRALAASAIRHA
jgi:hypothetical protein